MSKLFGMVLLLGLCLAVLVALGIMLVETINLANDTKSDSKAGLFTSPASSTSTWSYQLPQDYGLVDARLL
jgi:hypothetical protein